MIVRFSDLPPWRSAFEVVSIAVTVYSLAALFLEMECPAPTQRRVLALEERVVTGLFTAEYLFRWSISPDRRRYPLARWRSST